MYVRGVLLCLSKKVKWMLDFWSLKRSYERSEVRPGLHWVKLHGLKLVGCDIVLDCGEDPRPFSEVDVYIHLQRSISGDFKSLGFYDGRSYYSPPF